MKLTATFLLIGVLCLTAQDPPQEPPAGGQGQGQGQRPGGAGPQAAPEPRPYDRVITKEAKSKPGVFTVHQIRERWYYEIPKSELNKEFLWVSQIARTTLGAGYGGQALGNRVVRWERRGNRVLLRDVKYDVVSDPKLPVSQAVKASNNDAILRAFNIEAFGKDDSMVIDVGPLFTSDVYELSARQFLRATTLDASRTFVERVNPYPTNIEAEATHTYNTTPSPAGGAQAPASPFAPTTRPGSSSVVVHYSMVRLPEKPMMPRLYDERVGYFTARQIDYGRDEHKAVRRTFITRYRLEKKDPSAALSEPIKPITYYVDPATPMKWRPWIKKGIEDWQPAFEAAGFKNGIVAADPPNDPDWSPEDARYSVIRWLPSTIENASGPHIRDPRTGEILEADINFYHNVMNLNRSWYFVQVGPLDPRAHKLPLPDDLMGRLIEYVVAHEVGHTLGFQHNMKSSSMYEQAKLRDREWLKKMGHVATLMDYSRFNYVVQPEDNVPVEDLIPKIGPYDKWATMWGYKPIPGANTPDAEKSTLDEWAREQDKTPWLRFSTARAGSSDPGELTEAVGDADAVKSSTLGMKNLERVSNMLLSATSGQKGEAYDDLGELYGRMLGQWTLEMNHVAAIVGGFNTQQKHIGQEGVLYTPISRARQAEAVRFVNDNAFITPKFFIKPEILRRIEPVGVLDRVRRAQSSVLNNLLEPGRLARLVEEEALDGATTYAPVDFLADVRKGVWKELDGAAPVKIDAYRRNLQRAYVDIMGDRLAPSAGAPATPAFPGATPPPATTEDLRPFFRGELRSVSAAITAAMARATDRATRLHLDDIKDQIAKALDPKFAPPTAGAGGAGGGRRGFDDGFQPWLEPDTCWPDYIIRP